MGRGSRLTYLKRLGIEHYVRRRRHCSDCGHSWTTVELDHSDVLRILEQLEALQDVHASVSGAIARSGLV